MDIALASALIAILALIWQMQQSNKQARLNNFTIYTERYQNIVIHLPVNIESEDFDLQSLKKDEFEKTVRWLRAYFDLCSEEYYLWQNNLIDKKIWNLWEGGMSDAFKRPGIKQAWEIIQKDKYFSSEFDGFVTFLSKQSQANENDIGA